jgi:hypothetical protein
MNDTLDVVSFMAGGYRFGVEAHCVRAQLCGQLDGAVPAATLLGMAPDAGGEGRAQRVLLLKGDLALLVDEPVQLHHLDSGAIRALPALLAEHGTLRGMRALGLSGQEIIFLLDLGL